MYSSIIKAWNTIIGGIQNVHASGNALHTLDEEDAAIHQGESYHIGEKVLLAPGAIVWFSGTTGSRYYVHFNNLSIAATVGPVEVTFYSGSQITSGSGSIGMVHNRRLDISSLSDTIIRLNPTVTTTGDLVFISANLATASIAQNTSPQEAGFFHGFVLNRNSTYLIGLRNTYTSTATVWANFTYNEPIHL
jgi:hypothetical protein